MRLFSSLALICALFFVTPTTAERRETSATARSKGDLAASQHQQVLPGFNAQPFQPLAVFRNKDVARNINLEKSYVRVNTRVTVKNIDKKKAHNEYFIPFAAGELQHIGGIEAKEENAADSGKLEFSVSEKGPAEYLIVRFRKPLEASAETTLSLSYSIFHALSPLPSAIEQDETQFVVYNFPAYVSSAYKTDHQKTKVKYPNSNVERYTITSGLKRGTDPDVSGRTHTYGPYESIAPGTPCPTITTRYSFPKPIPVCTLLERDVEVSHFGGNLATEDRMWIENRAANLSKPFDRVKFTYSQLLNPPTSALQQMKFPLQPGSVDTYYVDDIGNVSTSHFTPSALEIGARYAIFGGWRYKFRIGWNNDLSRFLRQSVGAPGEYVLKIPFIQPPKLNEGIHYEEIHMRIILPEGASNVQHQLVGSKGLPSHIESSLGKHHTYMDTTGRTVLTLKTENVVDEARRGEIIVTYTYTLSAALQKPLVFAAALFASLAAVVFLSRLDLGIKKR